MAKKDRDYDTIIKGLDAALQAVENLKRDAKALSAGADSAGATLKDKAAEKDIQAIKDLADTINASVKSGEERLRELQQQMRNEKSRFEELTDGR
jgi:hypothetical protein